MKFLTKTILATILCLTSSSLMAQDAKWGIKGGLNLATIGGDASGNEMRTGFVVGFFSESYQNEKFAVQPEFVFSSQGTKSEIGDTKFIYNYVQIPVMFKFFPSEGFNIQAGPQFGFLTNGKVKVDSFDREVTDELNRFDVAVNVGLGFSNDIAIFSLRYGIGLTNTVEEDDHGTFPNRVLQLSVGFKFKS